MPRVVGVHGAFHELWGPHQVAGRWVPALRDGLLLAGTDIAPDDVAIAFYGDVFRPDPARPVGDVELAAIADRTGIIDAAQRLLGLDASREGLEALDALISHLGREQVTRTVAQLGRYFDDEAIRGDVRERLARVIDADTRVVVAHSLGSVVAYEVLVGIGGPARIDLVTLGSPLGHHAVIGTALRPALLDGRGRWPPSVRRCSNIVARNDPVAADHPVAAVFPGVVDLAVDNGQRAHDPEPYLCSTACGRAVAAGLA